MSEVCGLKKPKSGGGLSAILYTLRKARMSGLWRMVKAMHSRNACKTCALGMGGQMGGMVNEQGHWPSVCKKSVQAMAADLQGRIPVGFFEKFSLDDLKAFTSRELENSGRLTEPLIADAGGTHYRRASWDEALERIASKLKVTTPDETFFYFSGRSSNEAGFLLQLFARLYGTNNVNNCSYYCHQASGVGLSSVTGSGTATVVLQDVEECDTLVLLGGNPASNHPRFMHTILRMKRRGGKVIVVNPIRELGLVRFRVPADPRSLLFGSDIADEYVQPHIGGDIAFLAGVAKSLMESNAVDESYVAECTDGWKEFEQSVLELSWDEIVAKSGVTREQIDRVAVTYARSHKAIFAWAMGITHHEHGVQNVQMIANVAMMRGMLGKPSAGLLPLRGHSNVQGIGSMGVTPNLKKAVLERIEDHLQVKLPAGPGMDTMASVERAAEGKVRFAMCIGGNLYGSNPDAQFASAALAHVDQVVYLSTTMNTGHAHGLGKETIILPVLARDEESQTTTQESMFSYVRVSDGGPQRHPGPRSEVEVIARLAVEVLGDSTPVDWKLMEQHGEIRKAIAAVIPGYEEIDQVDASKKEFFVGGRRFHEKRFATESGRAQFHAVPLPDTGPESDQFRLMTVRSEGQFNTVVYEEEDVYRGQERRDVVMMNPTDRERLGLKMNQPVMISSDSGALRNVLVREIDVRAGNVVMYYPEANVLVPRRIDPASRTPAFKNVTVRISPL